MLWKEANVMSKEVKRMDDDRLVDKVNYKRAQRMSGYAPHKLFKMAIKGYLKKKDEKVSDIFDINKIEWRELNDEPED